MQILAPLAIGFGLSAMFGTEAMLTLLGVWAAYVFLVQRKPARVYRRTR